MALNSQDIQNIVAELRKLNITTAERLEDEQATRDVLKDQVKQLQFQDSLKQDINKAASQIYNITTDLLYEEKRVLGTRQANLAIQKDLDKVTKSINTLEENKNVLLKAGGKLNTDIADSIDKQLLNAKRLQKELEDQQKTSKEINNNFGTGGFQFLSELTSKLGGRASKLAQPFEKMADASREVVQNETLRNKKIGEFQQVKGDLEKITRGELKVTKDIAKKYGLVNKEGKLLTGASGKSAAQSALKVGEGLGNASSKASIMSKGLKAGLGSMGGMIKSANIYVIAAMAIVKTIQFIVDLFIKANEENVMLTRNLGVSRDTSIELRKEFGKIAAFNENLLVNSKELQKQYYAQVETLGQMGGIMKENLANAVFLEKNLNLGEETATKLTKNFSLFGENAEQVTSNIIDTKNAFNGMTGIGITNKRLFQEISDASKTTSYFNNNSTEALAKSALEAFKLGTNLKQAEQISTGLLNFEDSIRKELEAEVLLGKDLNFEKARGLALAGDDVAAAKEILDQTNKVLKGRKLNRIELQAIADASGLSTDELLAQNKLMDLNNKLDTEAKQILKDRIALLEKQNGPLSTAQQIQEAIKVAGGATYDQLESNITLQESFNAALDKLKQALVDLVEGGTVDSLVKLLQNLTKWLTVFYADEIEKQAAEDINIIKDKGTEEQKQRVNELEEAALNQVKWYEKAAQLLTYTTPLGPIGASLYGTQLNTRQEAAQQATREITEIRTTINIDSSKLATQINTLPEQ